MEILNIRFGHATNSSSTHSIVFFPDDVERADEDVDGCEFGWQFFTAASTEAKMGYMAVTLRSALRGKMSETAISMIVARFFGDEVARESKEGFIDHQSEWRIPREFGTNTPSFEFLKDISSYLSQPEVAILGGNDNDEESHPLYSYRERDGELPDYFVSDMVCRKVGDIWTLYDPSSGNKMRFSIGKSIQHNERAFYPELVDIKITDYCPKDCVFCYQNSSLYNQVPADPSSIVYTLAELQVFEVAIGGGEPTSHPGFVDLLSSCNYYGITPNFSTGDLSWMDNSVLLDEVMARCGRFAYSASSHHTIDIAIRKAIQAGCSRKMSIQSIIGPGLVDGEYALRYIIETCCESNVPLTLLGFKPIGRGREYYESLPGYKRDRWEEKELGWWVPILKEFAGKKGIGIDTMLANELRQVCSDEEVSPLLYHLDDTYSCYYDCTTGKLGPSSFCDEAEMVELFPEGVIYENQVGRFLEVLEGFRERE